MVLTDPMLTVVAKTVGFVLGEKKKKQNTRSAEIVLCADDCPSKH